MSRLNKFKLKLDQKYGEGYSDSIRKDSVNYYTIKHPKKGAFNFLNYTIYDTYNFMRSNVSNNNQILLKA